jgi:hypothetical protein
MNWYLAKIVFRIICGEGNHTAQFDEQLRLISASDKEEAFQKAVAMGNQEQDMFVNLRKELVKWQFINVSEIYRLSALIDGAELYSRIEEREDGDSYIHGVNKKAEGILKNDTNLILELV